MQENVQRVLGKYKKVIAWGAGKYFDKFHELISDSISYIVDKNEALQARGKNGFCVRTHEHLYQEIAEECLIVVFNAHFLDVLAEVPQYGDFDVINIVSLQWLNKIKNSTDEKAYINCKKCPVLVCGGFHAIWETNGSRKFIVNQNKVLHKRGMETLEISPLEYYMHAELSNCFCLVSYNGTVKGVWTLDKVAKCYQMVRGVIIHSLYYNHQILENLLEKITVEKSILYYLHDFYCICNNRFMYNETNSCIDNDGGIKCGGCSNKEKHIDIMAFHKKIFDLYNVILVAPSEDTALRVKKFYPRNDIRVIPHLKYDEVQNIKQSKISRIAYIGNACWLKGWNEYVNIFSELKGQYEFFCLGMCDASNYVEGIVYREIELENVGVKMDMTESLQKYEIDIVYMGAVWPETYSYTYYEAYEAGCFVITNELSGNISAQVKKNRNGMIFHETVDVIDWLKDKETVLKTINQMNGKKIINIEPDDTFMSLL